MAIKRTISQKAMMSGLVMVVLLLFVSAFSFASELDGIRAAIKEKNAKWIAGETSVSKLPPEQRKMHLGLIKPKATNAEKAISVETPLVGLPASLDWRSNPYNYVTPVRDQGSCGSCWAFATTGALESYTLIKNNQPNMNVDLAEQILVSCSHAGSCGGGYIDQASDFIRDTGLPEESCYPYTARNGNCRRACTNWWLNTDMIDSWSYVTTTSLTDNDIDDIKNALDTYGPLVTTMNVYTDFFSYESGIYSYASGNYEGGHAILIVGYDDANHYFIVKNSWGTNWGEDGFFNIAYSQINPPVEFGYWTIAYHQESGCTYSISPTSQSFPAAGGSGTMNVTADNNCSWTAVSNASWITITSGSSGTGNGSVQYSVAPNIKKKSRTRTGTITVAGQLFTVTQSGL
jgi:C1A family cysteine protease